METQASSNRRRGNRARERHQMRQRRRQAIAEAENPVRDASPGRHLRLRSDDPNVFQRAFAWLFSSKQPVAKLTTVVALAIVIFFVGSYVFTDRIFPNVYALGVGVGDMTPADAQAIIQQRWESEIVIDITVAGERLRQATPEQMGLSLDIPVMAKAAKAARHGWHPLWLGSGACRRRRLWQSAVAAAGYERTHLHRAQRSRLQVVRR